MARYLIDVNLPYRLAIWNGPDYTHMVDIDARWTDSQIWAFAKQNDLVIISKDADFSNRVGIIPPPPRVVHLCLGNCSLKSLHSYLAQAWPWVTENIDRCHLVRIFPDRIEAIQISE